MLPTRAPFSSGVFDATQSLFFFIVVALTTIVRLGASAQSLAELAQDVADAACPYAMMQEYGCPIPVSEWVRAEGGPGARLANATRAARLTAAVGDATWPVGSVPLGVGFDVTTLKVALPVLYPEGTSQPMFDVSIETSIYSSITDYVGSLQPGDTTTLLTGSLNTDVSSVASTFLGEFEMMIKATQVDVTQKATMTASPRVLPNLDRAFAYLAKSTDPERFTKMIGYWGTHVVTEASLGGAFEMMLSVQSCYGHGGAFGSLASYAQVYLSVQSMENPTGANLTNNQFVAYSSHLTLTMYGGDVTQLNWPLRQLSISQMPVLIKVGSLVPLWQYMPAGPAQTAFKEAIDAYIADTWSRQQAAAAAALAAQTFTITGLMTVAFDNFRTTFGYQQHHCHRCWLVATCCNCDGETACFLPAQNDGNCNPPVTGTLLFGSMPTTTLKIGQSATMSPDGSTSCNAASQNGFGTPSFPLGKFEQTFTCSVLSDGSVQASNVQNPGWNDPSRIGGSITATADGDPTFSGCSIASVTYSGAVWRETGGNQGCGATTGNLNSEGTFTAYGYCCVGVTPTIVAGSNPCFGSIVAASCPQP